jgi:hypothetical protein
MPIRPGEPWGRTVEAPADLVPVDSDARLAQFLNERDPDRPGPPVDLTGGDLRRTLGGAPRGGTGEPRVVSELPIDVLEVRLDDGPALTACAHVVVTAPWWRGGWLRGPIVMVMNAEFIGSWDVAPRGHPNDGRVEVLEADGHLTVRQRIEARRRMATATHVPHPRISTRSLRMAHWSFSAPMVVRLDGRPIGRARDVDVQVVPDGAVVYV